MFLKKFCLLLHNQANQRLHTSGAPSAPLSAATEQTLLIHLMPKPIVKITWHKLKKHLCSSPSSIMFSLWAALAKSWHFCCHFISTHWKTSRMLVTFSHRSMDVHQSKICKWLWTYPKSWSSPNHKFCSYFLEFCTVYEGHALICTLGHHKYNAWHKHCCLLVMTACNWMAAVSSRLIRAYRNMFRHTQQRPNLVWCRVTGKWTRFRYYLIGPHIILIFIIHSSLLLTVTVISHAH
jgi:hypothetical protein